MKETIKLSPYREQYFVDPSPKLSDVGPSKFDQLKRILKLNRYSHPKFHQKQHYREKIGGRWILSHNPKDKRIIWPASGAELDYSLLIYNLDDHHFIKQFGFWIPDIIWRDSYEEAEEKTDKEANILNFDDPSHRLKFTEAQLNQQSIYIEYVRFPETFDHEVAVSNFDSELGQDFVVKKIKKSSFWWKPHYVIKNKN
jgi:hypothetical protein